MYPHDRTSYHQADNLPLSDHRRHSIQYYGARGSREQAIQKGNKAGQKNKPDTQKVNFILDLGSVSFKKNESIDFV